MSGPVRNAAIDQDFPFVCPPIGFGPTVAAADMVDWRGGGARQRLGARRGSTPLTPSAAGRSWSACAASSGSRDWPLQTRAWPDQASSERIPNSDAFPGFNCDVELLSAFHSRRK